MLGFHRRRLRRCECDTVFPNPGDHPVTWQCADKRFSHPSCANVNDNHCQQYPRAAGGVVDALGPRQKKKAEPRVGGMRLKLGRPDLADYAGYFDAPAAAPDAPLTVTWAGVTTLLVDD